ncbi:MAG: PilT/PilU family type 4a pilus ATPase [Zetaproteobacteria bacterium]|nr:MAG: PilT/PilU family type 4a pilus ATPase [Zetaproteobacteria bacterium]
MTETKNDPIQQLLKIMVAKQASDLYITASLPPSLRINGEVRPINDIALTPSQTAALAHFIMNEKQRREFEEVHEMNLALSYPNIGRFRVNIFVQRNSIGMVIRQIATEVPTLEQLQLPEIFKDIVMSKRGLVIMVGATSSGKSTSLAAMVDYRNSHQAGHIITIEDPIEFIHQHKKSIVTQREVGTDTLDFKYALKNTLRQAPDVILIGEIRDRETMEHGLTFAETGHLCMATLHANNANQGLERIINFFPEEAHAQVRLNLAMNVRAILSQRLVKTTDGKRTAAVEILINTPRISDLIFRWDIPAIKEAMANGANYGMQTFDQHLFKLWKEGRITEEEALRHADSMNDVRLNIKMSKVDGKAEELNDDSLRLSPS